MVIVSVTFRACFDFVLFSYMTPFFRLKKKSSNSKAISYILAYQITEDRDMHRIPKHQCIKFHMCHFVRVTKRSRDVFLLTECVIASLFPPSGILPVRTYKTPRGNFLSV